MTRKTAVKAKREDSTVTMSRLITWVAQAAVTALCFVMYTNLQEMKVEVASIKAGNAVRDSQFTKLETKSAVVDDNVKEIKSDVKSINAGMQDLRVLIQGRR